MLYALSCREPDGYIRNIPLISNFIVLLSFRVDKKKNTQFETADILLLEPTFPLVTVRCVRVTVAFGTQTHVTEVNR